VTVSSSQNRAAGISRKNRTLLERLSRRTAGAFDAEQASLVLGIGRAEASQLLVHLARRGWLSRLRRGFYVAVPLDARRPGEWVDDPWVVAERVFSPCYIGGWSACAHWDLTEQVTRTLMVFTARRVRHRYVKIQGIPFHLTVRSDQALFGTLPVWHGQTRVRVSDPSRTIVDILDNPRLGGGIRTVAEVLDEYLHSEHRNDQLLIDYGDRLGNRAVFKRLGYLLERSAVGAPELVQACLERRSSGLVALDPSLGARGRIVRRWGLRVSVALGTPRSPQEDPVSRSSGPFSS
jgi:predicted transcriptional regulator of viral defense system